MCIFPTPKPPAPPKLPDPIDPPSAPEKTADTVVTGSKRKRTKTPTSRNPRIRSGTTSLRIPLAGGSGTRAGNLNY